MSNSVISMLRELQRQRLVWDRGRVIPGYDPAVWRWDEYGAVMRYDRYGDRASDHGWEIDHTWPAWAGGSDEIENLRPLNWRNNVEKGPRLPLPRFLR